MTGLLGTLPLRLAIHALRAFRAFPGRWRVLRWVAARPRQLLVLPPRQMPIDGGGCLIVEAYNNRDMYVENNRHDKDDRVLRAFDALVRPGDHVWDVGANIGRMSVVAARRVGERGRVRAFEPSPMVISSLYKNLAFNQCSNVTVRNCAVSDQAGTISFHMPLDTNSGLGSLREIGDGASTVIEVPMIRLDDESDQPARLRLLKIDVEGADLRVLRGASRMIQSARPAIIMEFSPRWIEQLGDSVGWFSEFVERIGYTLYRLTDAGPHRIDALPDHQIDLLCAPRPLAEMSWRGLAGLSVD